MAKNKSLGRGLDALFADNTAAPQQTSAVTLRLFDIEPNRSQPRKQFDDASLTELADSIREHGLIQPIVVRPGKNGMYEIVAGERRWRASRLAGLTEVPVVIKELDDRSAAELALVENLQREDLNPVEEAGGYRRLMDEFSLTQEQVAQRVGKSRAAIANAVRILALPQAVLSLVEAGELSYAHARTIVSLCGVYDDGQLLGLAQLIVAKSLSVRETERIVRSASAPKQKKEDNNSAMLRSYYAELEKRASDSLGRRVRIGKDSVTLTYATADDLERLLTKLCGNSVFEPSDKED